MWLLYDIFSMGSHERKQQLKKFLQKFSNFPISLPDYTHPHGQMQDFLITYLGKSFIQGYRILQHIAPNIFILSRMQCQIGGNQGTGHGHPNAKYGAYRVLCVEFNERMNEDRELRGEIFGRLRGIVEFLAGGENCGDFGMADGVEVHFLFAVSFQYSVVGWEGLRKGSAVGLEKFYKRDYGVGRKQDKEGRGGLKILDEREQGTKLHQLVQLLLKGSGHIRNPKHLAKSVLHHAKFLYRLDNIINTICLVIGKEMIQGGYTTISAEKWMRKFSQKKFKKFDLLLRNQHKVCIIDWKFSRVKADQKINTVAFANKNLQYFQLARKEYNAPVQLKFYCFHHAHSLHHHKFTRATYNYSIEEIQIKDREYLINEDNQIQIDSDSQYEDAPPFWTQKKDKKGHGHGHWHANRSMGGNNQNSKQQSNNKDQKSREKFSKVLFDKNTGEIRFEQKKQLKNRIDLPEFFMNDEVIIMEKQKQTILNRFQDKNQQISSNKIQKPQKQRIQPKNKNQHEQQMMILSDSQDERPIIRNNQRQSKKSNKNSGNEINPPTLLKSEIKKRKNIALNINAINIIEIEQPSQGENCIVID